MFWWDFIDVFSVFPRKVLLIYGLTKVQFQSYGFLRHILGSSQKVSLNRLLSKYQSGFRAICFTDSCLAQLTDFVLTCVDKGMHTDMILTDLQKTFDTLDLKIILEKLTCLGFKTPVIKGFELSIN